MSPAELAGQVQSRNGEVTAGAIRDPGRSLRIVHFVGQCGPDVPNGIARVVHFLSEAQRAIGHDVRVITYAGQSRGQASDDGSPGSRRKSALAVITSAYRHVSPVVDEVLALQPDVVHLHSIHSLENILLSWHLRRARLRYCVTVHGGLSPTALRRNRFRKRLLGWLTERSYLNRSIFVHALTEREARDVREYGVECATVTVPNGLDLAWLSRSTDHDALFAAAPELRGRRVFMFIGRLDPAPKGLDLLLAAFAAADVPMASLVLVGPDWRDGRRLLETQAAALGLGSRVVFLGEASRERCADLLASADVFVHPSRWEGVSLAVLEAAGFGKASLLSVQADPEGRLSAAGGSVTVPPTVAGLADGIRALASLDRDALAAMGARAREVATTTFSWTKVAATLVEAYRNAGLSSGERVSSLVNQGA